MEGQNNIWLTILGLLGGALGTKFLLPLIDKWWKKQEQQEKSNMDIMRGDLEKQLLDYRGMLAECNDRRDEQTQRIILLTEEAARFKALAEAAEKSKASLMKSIASQKEDIGEKRAIIMELRTKNDQLKKELLLLKGNNNGKQ